MSALTDETSAGIAPVKAEPAAPSGRDPDAGAPRLVRNLGALAGGQVVTWSVTLLWTLVVPRALGPAGFGLIVSALSVSGVLGIVLGLGTRNYLVREIVVDGEATPALVGTAMVLRLSMAPFFVLAAVVYADLTGYGHQAAMVLYLVAAATVLTLLAEPIQAGFQAFERMKYLAYSDIVNKSAQSLGGIALVLLGFGAVSVATNMALVAVSVLLLNLLWRRRFFRIARRTSLRQVRSMIRHSVAFWAFGVFGMIYLWIDAVMLSLMTRPDVVGWYGAPTRLFQTLMFLPVLASTAWLPRLVSAFQQGPDRLLETARKPTELVLMISAPICAGTALLAGPIIHGLYGSAYGPAVPVLIILALCIPPMYLNIMLSQVLLAAKRQMAWTWVMGGAAVANPIFNLVLIPLTQSEYGNGAIGAGVSLLLTELLMVAVGMKLVGRKVFSRQAVRRCGLVLGASAAMWTVGYASRPLGTPASLIAAAATFVLLIASLRIVTSEEIALMRTAMGRLRGRRLA